MEETKEAVQSLKEEESASKKEEESALKKEEESTSPPSEEAEEAPLRRLEEKEEPGGSTSSPSGEAEEARSRGAKEEAGAETTSSPSSARPLDSEATPAAGEVPPPRSNPPRPPQVETKKSPAQAFEELRLTVSHSLSEISDLWDFVQKVKKKYMQEAEIYQQEGARAAIESLVKIFDMLYTRIHYPGEKQPEADNFTLELSKAVEGEMNRHQLFILQPKEGDSFDPKQMECVETVPSSFRHKPNTVSKVNRCGLALAIGKQRILYRRSRVTVYKKGAEMTKEKKS